MTSDILIEYPNGDIVLAKRKNPPYKGEWGLPGGKMDGDETIEETAIREAKEETGLDIKLKKVIGVYSAPYRDPRGRYISVAFLATPVKGKLKAGSDAASLIRASDPKAYDLAFDHQQIIKDYLRIRRLKSKRK
jgi:8-oxo-dGTP diphosphatase